MTEFQTYAFAYGVIFILLGIPMIWAIRAARRQLKAGNVSREIVAGSKQNQVVQSSFKCGMVVAILFAAKRAFSNNSNFLALALLVVAAFVIWLQFRAQKANLPAKP